MKIDKRSGLIVLILIIIAFLFISFGRDRGPLIGDGITLYRTVLGDKPTSQGFVYIPFARTSEDVAYVNVAVDVNGDGVFAGYDTPSGYQEEWVVQNDFPEVIKGEANRFVLAVIDPAFGTKPISGVAVLSATAFPPGTWSTEREVAEKEKKTFTITSVTSEVRDLHMTLDRTGKLATGMPPLTLGTPVAHAAPPAPPVAPAAAPGDYYWFHADVPDQNQLWNECAPTAISNSFRWLAKEHKLEDHMPKGGVNDLIDEIKGDVAWNDGVAHENIIKGKQEFIKRHDLPLEAHQIGSRDDGDIVRKINAELEKGQAVEAWLSFFGPDGAPAGAHLVTVVGAGHKNGKDIVRFTDPDTIGAPSRDAYNVEGGNYLPQYWPGSQTYITYAYAQSPIPSLIDRTWVDPRRPEALVLAPGQTLTPPEQDLTLSRSQFGFFSTSIGHPGDHYVGDTFTVRAVVFKTGKRRTVDFTNAAGVKSSWTHGAEKPWTLKGSFIGGGAVSPALADDKPPTTSLDSDRFSVEQNFTCVSPGFATVSYKATLNWKHTPGPVPPEILSGSHGAEFQSTSDEMQVESPSFRCIAKPEVKKDESRTAGPTAFCPGVQEDPSGKEIDVLKSGSECYPTLQFHEAGADKCDATHWHANMGTARSLSGGTWVDPSGCGFGKVADVPAGKVKLSPDQAAPFIDSAPMPRR